MKGMKSQQEFYTPPPPGRYLSIIEGAESKISAVKDGGKGGATMIKLSLKIIDPQYAGATATDHIITQAGAGGASMGKIKLRGLGVFEMFGDTDDDVPDSAICQRLVGTQIYVEYGNEDQTTKESNYTEPATVVHNGVTVTLQKLVVKGYARHPVGGAQAQAPQQLQQPVQQMAPPQGQYAQVQQQFAPQQMVPQGYQQPVQQQLAPQGQWQGQPQQGQGFAPQMVPQQGFAPQGQQFAPMAAAPPWNGNGVAIPPPPAAEATGGKRKKLKVDDVSEG